ncbi:hypothetical protein ACLOJK_032998 [Asimina triloba]
MGYCDDVSQVTESFNNVFYKLSLKVSLSVQVAPHVIRSNAVLLVLVPRVASHTLHLAHMGTSVDVQALQLLSNPGELVLVPRVASHTLHLAHIGRGVEALQVQGPKGATYLPI